MTTEIERRRTSTADERAQLLPWRKAESLTRCHLYWMPCEFPIESRQKSWILTCLNEISQALAKRTLVSQTFLQVNVIHPHLLNDFVKTAKEFTPFFGLSRQPAAPLPALPDMKYIEDLQKGRQSWKFGDRLPDYCYWFIGRQEEKQRELFLGHGGMTIMFVKGDPENAPPPPPRPIPPGVARSPIFAPILKQWNPSQGQQTATSLKAPFLKKSKEFFGHGLEEDPQYPGLIYILPLLTSADFFQQPDTEAKSWFETFDVYCRESTVDRGLILASKEDLNDTLIAIVAKLKDQSLRYPELP